MKKLHIIRLPDYSIPPIVSGGTKEYVGTKEDIKKVVPNHDIKNTDECVVLAEATCHHFATEHIFINTYGFDHTIKADKIEASIIHIFDGKKYMRCIKAKMNNLQIGVNGQDYYKPDSFMGYPNILYIEKTGYVQIFMQKSKSLKTGRLVWQISITFHRLTLIAFSAIFSVMVNETEVQYENII